PATSGRVPNFPSGSPDRPFADAWERAPMHIDSTADRLCSPGRPVAPWRRSAVLRGRSPGPRGGGPAIAAVGVSPVRGAGQTRVERAGAPSNPMTTLITERLTLTPVAVSDYDDLRAMWADPDVIRHIFPGPLSEEDVWFRLLRDLGHWEALGHGNWT